MQGAKGVYQQIVIVLVLDGKRWSLLTGYALTACERCGPQEIPAKKQKFSTRKFSPVRCSAWRDLNCQMRYRTKFEDEDDDDYDTRCRAPLPGLDS